MNPQFFLIYLRSQLIPSLNPGDIVTCDNLSSHKIIEAREVLESKGIELVYLPTNSPGFNPIELVFSKLKTLIRKAVSHTLDALAQALAKALGSITKKDCRTFFKHASYANEWKMH